MPVNEKQIAELEEYFKNAKLPLSVQLDEGSKVENVSKFVESHLKVLQSNGDKPMYDVFFLRLLKMKDIISTQ